MAIFYVHFKIKKRHVVQKALGVSKQCSRTLESLKCGKWPSFALSHMDRSQQDIIIAKSSIFLSKAQETGLEN